MNFVSLWYKHTNRAKMEEIIILVENVHLELFKSQANLCNCNIINLVPAKNKRTFLTVESSHIVNFYDLGYMYGSYSPVFISN